MKRVEHLTIQQKRMKTFLVLICTVALACAAGGAQEKDKSKKQAPKKNQAQSSQHTFAASGGTQKAKQSQKVTTPKHYEKTAAPAFSRGTSAGTHNQKSKEKQKRSQYVTAAGERPAGAGGYKTKGKTKGTQQIVAQGGQAVSGGAQKTKEKTKGSQQFTAQQGARYDAQKTKSSKVSATAVAAFQSSSKTFKAHQFTLQNKTRPATVTGVTFQQNRRIQGSQNWQGKNYWAFRNYRPVWHERTWWNHHYNRVVFVYGGWYYWNAGWWYPAWGYAPNEYYAYDGPIYGYNDLPPDQVVANVQAALQQQGYYQGQVDGLLGPLTRAAIADYQRDRGLYITSAIDRPTLASLGMT